MSTVPWSDALIIGHEQLDAEHKVLIDLATRIEEMMVAQDGGPAIADYFDRFHRLLVAHCAYEERLMGALPADIYAARVAAHCRGHAILIEQSRELLLRIRNDGKVLEPFRNTLIGLMIDLIKDDSDLIGAMMREGYPASAKH